MSDIRQNAEGNLNARPFLKWTGGKRWLTPVLSEILPSQFARYHEPFLGGGALFFHLRAWPATLSDINSELINAYQQIRDNVDEVIERLSALRLAPRDYYRIRSQVPRLPVTRAVRLIYLNRAAFNGIYRVNQSGEFNVPFGCKPGTMLCDELMLFEASQALSHRTIQVMDFETAINRTESGDVVYADPPYTTQHDNNGFRRYNESLFSWSDQERLALAASRAAKRGVHVIVSNAAHEEISKLYQGFASRIVTRYTSISAASLGRGSVSEKVFSKVHK